MNIKPYVTKQEMLEEVNMWNNSGLTPPSVPATLKEFMFVEDDNATSKGYKYHFYVKEGNRYRLINRKPFNIFYETDDGRGFGEEPKDMQALI